MAGSMINRNSASQNFLSHRVRPAASNMPQHAKPTKGDKKAMKFGAKQQPAKRSLKQPAGRKLKQQKFGGSRSSGCSDKSSSSSCSDGGSGYGYGYDCSGYGYGGYGYGNCGENRGRGNQLWLRTFWYLVFLIGAVFILFPYTVHQSFASQFAAGTIATASSAHHSQNAWIILISGWILAIIALWGLDRARCGRSRVRFVGGCGNFNYRRNYNNCCDDGCGSSNYDFCSGQGYGYGYGYGYSEECSGYSGERGDECGIITIDWVQVLWTVSTLLLATFLDGLVQVSKIQWSVPTIYYVEKVLLGSVIFYFVYRYYLECGNLRFECNLLITSLVTTFILHLRYLVLHYFVSTFVLGFFVVHFLFLWISAFVLAWIFGRYRLRQVCEGRGERNSS